MKSIQIELKDAKIGEIVTWCSNMSIVTAEVISFEKDDAILKSVRTGYVFKKFLTNSVRVNRELSQEELDSKIAHLESRISDLYKRFEAGQKSGSMVHHTKCNVHISMAASVAYTRMVDYINELEMELQNLKR